MKLSEQQQRAVTYLNGPALVSAGPGSGKCISGSSIIFTDQGLIEIQNIPKTYKPTHISVRDNEFIANIISYDQQGAKYSAYTSHWFDMGFSKTIKITTHPGYSEEGTYEHPLLCLDQNGNLEFKKLIDINIGDYIAISKNNELWSSIDIVNEDIAILLGFLVADGCLNYYGNESIRFSNSDNNVINELYRIINTHFPQSKIISRNQKKGNGINHTITRKSLRTYLESIGLKMCTAGYKDVPWSILQSSRNIMIKFIQSYFDLEGHVSKKGFEVTSKSSKLIHQLQIILLNFGIRSTKRITYVKGYSDPYYRLTVSGESIRIFQNKIGFRVNTKAQAALERLCQKTCNPNFEVYPLQENKLKNIRNNYFRGQSFWNGKQQSLPNLNIKNYFRPNRGNPPANKLQYILSYVSNTDDRDYQFLLNISTNMMFEKVIQKDYSNNNVYDFTVPKLHSFVANGLVNHNTATLTSKFAFLIQQGYNPRQILAVTFTNKAAAEMKERLIRMTGLHGQTFEWTCTIHSSCLQIVKANLHAIDRQSPISIYKGADQKGLIRDILKSKKLDTKKLTMPALSAISDAKDQMNPKKYLESVTDIPTQLLGHIVDIFAEYQNNLKSSNAIDFDDMLWYTCYLLATDKSLRSRFQNMFQYILVDEYQDVNNIQNKIIKTLSTNNVTLVGDDFQCWHKDCEVRTGDGIKKISDLRIGELVTSIYKHNVTLLPITAIQKQPPTPTIKIITNSGKCLIITNKHKCFTTKPIFKPKETFYVYMMYRHDKGFRIGILTGGLKGTIHSRPHPERPDRMWFLKRFENKQKASYFEKYISFKYQVPTYPFYHNGNNLSFGQNEIDSFFEEFGQNGWKLIEEFNLEFDYPNFIPEATTRHNTNRIHINVIMNETRGTYVSFWSNGRRWSKLKAKYKDAFLLAQQEKINENADIIVEKFHFDNQTRLDVVPASQLTIDMQIPIIEFNFITNQWEMKLESIIDIENYPIDDVYHIEVDRSGILVANDIISHNSIYGWRGANPEYFINFKKDYPNGQIFRLEQNYRCPQEIVKPSNDLIANNIYQIKKNCYSEIIANINPVILSFNDDNDEADAIATACDYYRSQMNVSYDQIAILYRAKFISRAVEQSLVQKSIPYTIIGAVPFFERREINDIMSYLLFSQNEYDEVSFKRICMTPRKGIGEKTIQNILSTRPFAGNIINHIVPLYQSGSVSNKAGKGLKLIVNLSYNIKSMKPKDAIEEILKQTKYYDYIEYISNTEEELEDRQQNIQELIALADKHTDIPTFLEECSLVNPDKKEEQTESVKLMTIHSAKGLEFQVVFIIGLEDGMLPHYKSDEAEERRLFYVAMTRSSHLLNMSWARYRTCTRNSKPSRFLDEVKMHCQQ